jgi:threonine dehydrogenase-like Zn-dependent dehydrogenase
MRCCIRDGGIFGVSFLISFSNGSFANHFPIGAVMEKGLTFRASIANIQKYWKNLLELLDKGSIDPTFLISHHMSLDRADDAYKVFDRKEHKALKIMLKPEHKV